MQLACRFKKGDLSVAKKCAGFCRGRNRQGATMESMSYEASADLSLEMSEEGRASARECEEEKVRARTSVAKLTQSTHV